MPGSQSESGLPFVLGTGRKEEETEEETSKGKVREPHSVRLTIIKGRAPFVLLLLSGTGRHEGNRKCLPVLGSFSFFKKINDQLDLKGNLPLPNVTTYRSTMQMITQPCE